LKRTPFFSQWESRDLTNEVVRVGAAAALARDPLWAGSGAASIDEYVEWAAHLCGMACLKMILAARSGRDHPMLELARECTRYGGYRVEPDRTIKGLIYAPFVEYVAREFGLRAEVVTGIGVADIAGIMQRAEYFIASVHYSIRRPELEPPRQGGHLVLVLGAGEDGIAFHNPSGHDAASQENVRLATPEFGRFFAGRGIAVY
jgi:hypothetical protein